MRRRCRRLKIKNAFTVIELLVAIAVLSVIAGLILPAVQAAREKARTLRCSAQLREVGTAIVTELERAGGRGVDGYLADSRRRVSDRMAMIQPAWFLSEAPGFKMRVSHAGKSIGTGEVVPGIWVCPSDSANLAPRTGRFSNYLANLNKGNWDKIDRGVLDGRGRPVQFSLFTDGRSNTAFFSERMAAPDELETLTNGGYGDWRAIATTPELTERSTAVDPSVLDGNASDVVLRDLVDDCRSAQLSVSPLVSAVRRHGGAFVSVAEGYLHVLPPNAAACRVQPKLSSSQWIRHLTWVYSLPTATSRHPGGVNVLFADNSARFVGESIETDVWSAIGSSISQDVVAAF